ncbi:hypothetical protein BDZ91DRAFT_748162 [Kalaharituber pfeilii]|nr:hypothetical protein BDZ91DRAFT_748162 [Kalaharituber pfeilii]
MKTGHKCRPLVITQYSIVYSSLAKKEEQLTKNGIEYVQVTDAIDICKLTSSTARLGYVECDRVIGR